MKINTLQENDTISAFYLVVQKSLNDAKNGRKFINVDVCDNTGKINGKVWDNAEEFFPTFKAGEIIKVKARVVKFKGALQLNISNIRVSSDIDQLNIGDFLPATDKDIDAMFSELKDILLGVENQYLRILLESFILDEDFCVKLKKSIAARSFHHNYIGGLLEHTLSVVKICKFLAEHYNYDKDLFVTIGFLHDLGKIKELASDINFDYTVEGNLKGHIVLGCEMIANKIKDIVGFPDELKHRIEHAVLSHHGQLEWGAPVIPKTPEAILLHYADNMDAKTIQAQAEIKQHSDQDAVFTQYNQFLGRALYLGG